MKTNRVAADRVTDVSKKDQFEALIAAAVREFGRVDIMVNNAGIAMIQDFLDVTKADYDKVLGVNLEGASWGIQAAARQMMERATRSSTCLRSIRGSPIRESRPMRSRRAA